MNVNRVIFIIIWISLEVFSVISIKNKIEVGTINVHQYGNNKTRTLDGTLSLPIHSIETIQILNSRHSTDEYVDVPPNNACICKPVCTGGCHAHSSCTAPETCTCDPGYEGEKICTPICKPACPQNSRCIAPGVCQCHPKYVKKCVPVNDPLYPLSFLG